jgi:uncharacterized protein
LATDLQARRPRGLKAIKSLDAFLPPAMRPRLASALAIGVAGGLVFWWLNWPLAWLLGPMTATTLAALAKADIAVPGALRTPMLAVLGVLLGSGFTPEMVGELRSWLPTLLSLPAYVALVTLVSALYLRKVAGFDMRTAFFAGTPGGFGEMVIMGDQAGGDVRRIALVHAVRILFIVMAVPILVRSLGMDLPAVPQAKAAAGWIDILGLLAAAALGGWLGQLCRLPAPALLGGMLVSAVGHALGVLEGAPPVLAIALAQLVIGCSIGCRFVGFRLHDVLGTMVAGFGLTVVMLAASFVAALGIHLISDASPLLLLLALMPGGVAEMSVIGLALDVDPAFVAAHHIVRIAIVVAAAPIVFRWLARREQRNAGPKAGV